MLHFPELFFRLHSRLDGCLVYLSFVGYTPDDQRVVDLIPCDESGAQVGEAERVVLEEAFDEVEYAKHNTLEIYQGRVIRRLRAGWRGGPSE